MRSHTLHLMSLFALLTAGCGGGDPDATPASTPESVSQDGAPSMTVMHDTTATTPRAEAGGGTDGCSMDADDPPDDEGVDANCDGVDGVIGKDVYVNAATGLATNAGTPTAPMRTVGAALTLAKARGGGVLLASGTYEIAQIAAEGDWSVYGGYADKFHGAPNRANTTLQASASGLLVGWAAAADAGANDAGAVYVEAGTHSSKGRLAHLTVQGLNARDDAQTSAHGLRVVGVDLELDDVVVAAGLAKDGTGGTSGDKGADGIAQTSPPHVGTNILQPGASGLQCDSVAQPPFTNGANGNSKGASDYHQPGPAGASGTHGPNADKSPTIVDQLLAWNSGAGGLTDAAPGVGGAGGLAFGYATVNGTNYYVGAGGGGTGGCAGKPGTGAKSGGGSVAVLVLGGHLTVTRSLFKTDAAGNGGDGGRGGVGGNGGAGGVPPAGSGAQPYGDPAILNASCVSGTPTDVLGNGCRSYGGPGGLGGTGAAGGAGSGGWTLGIVSASGTTVDVDPKTQFQLGKPGLGGVTDGVRGPDGEKHNTIQIP